MGRAFHDCIDLLTTKDVETIQDGTDQLQLNWAETAFEVVQPDGMALLRPPGGDLFEPWLDGLATRLFLDVPPNPNVGRIDEASKTL